MGKAIPSVNLIWDDAWWDRAIKAKAMRKGKELLKVLLEGLAIVIMKDGLPKTKCGEVIVS